MGKVTGGDKVGVILQGMVSKLSNAARVEVGFAEGDTYPDGTSLPLVAALNEFGRPDKGQPPRPFMRNTVAAHRAEWIEAVPAVLKAANYDGKLALERIGQQMQGDVVRTINTFTDPPLAQSTIDRKGFSKPLVDTAFMSQHVSLNVKE